jgi:hypothetical protein
MEYDLRRLESFDTPTICNALEMIEPDRRRFGYTTQNVVCLNSSLGPRVGVALTGAMRSAAPPPFGADELKSARLKYYEYMHQDVGTTKICAMQDLDGTEVGRGPFWGEFNVRIHRAMNFGAIVTDGSVRDVGKLPNDVLIVCRGLRPSHAYVHIVDFDCQITIFGMTVTPGDVIHTDEHGAVTFPRSLVAEVAVRAAEFMAGEAPIIDACKADRLTMDELTRLYLARPGIRQDNASTHEEIEKRSLE